MPSRAMAVRSCAGSVASGSLTPPNLGDGTDGCGAGSVVPESVAHSRRTVLGVVVEQERDEDQAEACSDPDGRSGQSRDEVTKPRTGAEAADESGDTHGATVERRKRTQHESSCSM